MIENERQYQITSTAVEELNRTLRALHESRPVTPDVHPALLDAQEAAIRSQLADFQAELRTYEARRVS
jgi:hypothetical protein